jgi:hypothetical protein
VRCLLLRVDKYPRTTYDMNTGTMYIHARTVSSYSEVDVRVGILL